METTAPILCLGEAIVDLIADRPPLEGQVPDRLVPSPGGALANVAVAAARAGAPAALAGGVGGDAWGNWLRGGLEREGVSTRWLVRLDAADTPLGIVLLDHGGEPSFQIYGEHIGATMAAAEGSLEEAVEASAALVAGSNTMVGKTEREVTRKAVRLARDLDRPLLFDPNFRPSRWAERGSAVEYCLELAGEATVIKLNRAEGELITGETGPLEAARKLAHAGAGLVVVTDGSGPVVTAGAVETVFTPEPVEVVSPLGAGDAFMGSLAAGLVDLDWDLGRAGEVLPAATVAAGAICGCRGAQG